MSGKRGGTIGLHASPTLTPCKFAIFRLARREVSKCSCISSGWKRLFVRIPGRYGIAFVTTTCKIALNRL